jgi:peptide/nickel transport system substrate-binding protein
MSEHVVIGDLTRRDLMRRAGAAGAAIGLVSPLSGCFGGDDDDSQSAASGGTGPIQKGGRLRIGFVGNGTSESLFPITTVAIIDVARAENLFDNLVKLKPDNTLSMELAESFEPNKTAGEWTIRLRDGVTWHDGAPLTADDLIYTLQQVADPKLGSSQSLVTSFIDIPKLRKMDARTVRVPMVRPNSELPQFFVTFQVVKKGAKKGGKPVGTGPFVFESFTAGRQSVFKKNPNYWQSGKPYVDELVCVSIPDQTARLNALLGGQVDAIEGLSYAQAKAQANSQQVRVLQAKGPNDVPIYMATTLDPFRDVRVRQAMRLIADRPKLVQSAQVGFGDVANDIFGKGLPEYADDLPQREQDIDKAKSLLKAAGQEGLTVTLYSSTVAQGMLESATLFAADAKKAGVKIKVENQPAGSYFGPDYLKQNFAQSLWFSESIVSHMARSIAPGAPFNETHWDNDNWTKVWNDALRTTDDAKRHDLIHELQRIQYEEGGYIEWGTFPLLDGVSTRVRGAVPNSAQPLGNYNFRDWSLSS